MSDLLNKHDLPKPFRLGLNCDDEDNDCHAQILLNAELADRIQNAFNKMKDESGIISIAIDCETTWHDSRIKPRDNQRIFGMDATLLKSTNDESSAIADDDYVYAVVDGDNSDNCDYAGITGDDGLLVHKHGWICAQGRNRYDGSICQSVDINMSDLNSIINHIKDSEFSFDANNEPGASMGL